MKTCSTLRNTHLIMSARRFPVGLGLWTFKVKVMLQQRGLFPAFVNVNAKTHGKNQRNNPKNYLHSVKLGALATIFNLAGMTGANAQVVPFDDTETYEVVKIANKGVCFAATKALSENKRPMVYTYYHTVGDQRWHVLGYEIDATIPATSVTIAVDIDGETTLARETVAANSDFMLPFENIDEISNHEELSKTGESMNVKIAETEDRVSIDLGAYREALPLLQACLTSFNEGEN